MYASYVLHVNYTRTVTRSHFEPRNWPRSCRVKFLRAGCGALLRQRAICCVRTPTLAPRIFRVLFAEGCSKCQIVDAQDIWKLAFL